MSLDKRVPAVYVEIEDRSLAMETIEAGRSGYIVILSDRGPHNRVVRLNSRQDLYDLFGRPDFIKHGQAHYIADMFLTYSANLYVVRPALVTYDTELTGQDLADAKAKCMTVANRYISANEASTDSLSVAHDYTFTNGSNIVTFVGENSLSYEDANGLWTKVAVGDYIYPTNADPGLKLKITEIDLETVTTEGSFYHVKIDDIPDGDESALEAIETADKTTVIWIAADSRTSGQVILAADGDLTNKVIKYDADTNAWSVVEDYEAPVGNLEITLDGNYEGDTVSENIKVFSPFSLSNAFDYMGHGFDVLDNSILWYFSGYGAGAYYNDLFIKGVRNTELERMYTDEDGEPLYPYAFLDIAIYERLPDNTVRMVEGPWSVSLLDRTATGSIIRDVFTGMQLYIVNVINDNSKLIQCHESLGYNKLMTLGDDIEYPYSPDVTNRKAVQALFTQGDTSGLISATSQIGIQLTEGRNGSLYNNNKLEFFGNTDYEALVAQAYNGSLQSSDGSIELIVQEIYPWYLFDYVLSGGYSVNIQNSARELCDVRGDCLLLADTGMPYNSATNDLTARQNTVTWNTWNAALYGQYRERFDIHTGKKFYITPVFHAIERHLYTDSRYWIAEPVAGIEKGAISEAINLLYRANFTQLGDLLDAEINPTIVEPDGVYFLTQFSTWKRLSIMKRLHVVKFVHYLKKRIPPLLKDILQRRATQYWINQCNVRLNAFLQTFLEVGGSDRYVALKSFSAVVNFDELRSEINVTLTIRPIRAIERIHVNIIVI